MVPPFHWHFLRMKNFVIPIDFSAESLKGLDLALLFSQHRHVNAQMVYVHKGRPSGFGVHEEYSRIEEKFEKLVAEYQPAMGNDSRLRYIIKAGKVYEEVVTQAESYKDAVIAMSTHGASGFEEFFLGSNAFRIISATTLPVFTIRHSIVPKQISRIVLPIDVSLESRQKVPMTAEVATIFGAEVHILSVSLSRNGKSMRRLSAYASQTAAFLEKQGVRYVEESVVGDNIADITVEYAHAIDAGMISIITEQEASMTNLILGNVAQQLLNKANTIVLNITPREMRRSTFNTWGGPF